MAGFITELDVRCINDGRWKLDSPLRYLSDIVGLIDVPAGFETDFASVPRVPILYTFFGDRAHREAVLHDYLYRKDSIPMVERSQADDVFFEAMDERGKGFLIRYGMWLGVRAGGWTAYHEKLVTDKL